VGRAVVGAVRRKKKGRMAGCAREARTAGRLRTRGRAVVVSSSCVTEAVAHVVPLRGWFLLKGSYTGSRLGLVVLLRLQYRYTVVLA
jgi:hypothetical protein